ncbi:hypothetical protein GPECTOR_95g679 [Gonium pectorale]|uniref:PDZ domain-containing protein n=1 Tax=Gonium pectorale TaxID=33097 RepID=A0A150G1W2_GONPE|nr:hypothetical protein GPECTOR_95g679 [Gonium pectorale]|eukprot:KXZ43290.1 hypothetical protein GPECTOR_95g679 [Gonium pectorale]
MQALRSSRVPRRGSPALSAVPTVRAPRTQHRSLPRCRSSAAPSDGVALQDLRPVRATAPNDDTGGLLEAEVLARPGSRVFTASVKKPLGLVLAEKGGRIVVESVSPGGHAAAAGIAAGDVLLATGARAQVRVPACLPACLPA